MRANDYPAPSAGWYAIAILSLAYLLSIVDRHLLALLLVPIQDHLQVSDTQMGILHGFTFAIFYAVMGLPISRLIDAGRRRLVIGIGIALWSLATASCGLADHYWQLLLARIFVAVGEAALLPGAVSLIADYFPPERRGSAMGVFAAGATTGNGAAMLAGGVVAGLVGSAGFLLPGLESLQVWQRVFVVIGLPGLAVALIIATIPDPGRRGSGEIVNVPVCEIGAYMMRHRATYTAILMGTSIYYIGFLGYFAWTPTLLIRSFGWSPQEAGRVFGMVLIVTGPLGAVFGGWLADWWARHGKSDGKMRVMLLAAIGLAVFGPAFPLFTDSRLLIAVLIPCGFASSMLMGMPPACIQDVTPAAMRGQITALYTGILNLIGFGLGSVLVALLTDYVFRDPAAVGYSMAIVTAAGALAAIVIFVPGLSAYRASRLLIEAG